MLPVSFGRLQEAVLEQVQLGAELSSSDTVSASDRVHRFLGQTLESHEQILSSAQEAVGHAVGQLSGGEKCQFSPAVRKLFTSVLKSEADNVLSEINKGHLQLRHPNKEERAALTSKLYNVLTTAHLLVSILMISGAKVCSPLVWCQGLQTLPSSIAQF